MEFHSVLIPVSGKEADEESVELACRLAKSSPGARLCAVHVISVDRSLPLDAEVGSEISKAEKILSAVEAQAQKLGNHLETDLLQAREVGPAIVDEAVERKVDVIILGLSYKTRFGEFCLGEVAPYILQNAPCRVILYHQRQAI